jgi:hypothetical protein
LSDTEKNQIEESGHLFENEIVKITSEGDLILKETSVSEERVITKVDPDKYQEKLDELGKSFEKLSAKADKLISKWSEKATDKREEAVKAIESFKEEILGSDAVGDMAAIIGKLDSALTEIKTAVEEVKESAEEVVAVEKTESKSVTEEAPEENKVGSVQDAGDSDTASFYAELADKAEALLDIREWGQAFKELDLIDENWNDGPEQGDVPVKEFRDRINAVRKEIEKRKAEYQEKQAQQRLQNLEKKKNLLENFSEIVTGEKWDAEKEVKRIKIKWDQIRSLPHGEGEKLQEKFDKLNSVFDEHKVDQLVKKLQIEEENLAGKLVVLDKMDQFVKSLEGKKEGWENFEKELNTLDKQWRKIGRIPLEKTQETWDRYHKAHQAFHDLRFKEDESYRKSIEKFLSQKKQLIAEAEALVDIEDLAEASRKVNKLHRRWKKIGNLPQIEENELWDRFKAASDAFNQKKADNIDVLRDQEEENLKAKMELIKEAEKLKDSEEWEETHKELQNLMNRWKDIGPVPKRKSGKIWKKFKGAMDAFYEKRREHFKDVKEERKDNLKEKKQVIDELKALQTHENPIDAVELAKPLQEKFKEAGYVPLKYKNKLWKDYREACDVIYERFRAVKSAADVVGKENVSDFSADDIADIRKKQKEADNLRKQIKKMSDEVLQMNESLSYFKASKGSTVLEDAHARIADMEKKIDKNEDALAALEKEIDLMMKDS